MNDNRPKKIDWSNPLSRGLLVAIIPPHLRNIVNGQLATRTTDNVLIGVRETGYAFLHNTVGGSVYSFHLDRPIPATVDARYTYAVIHAWNEGPQTILDVSVGSYSSPKTLFWSDWPNLIKLRQWAGASEGTASLAVTNSDRASTVLGGWDGANVWCSSKTGYAETAWSSAPQEQANNLHLLFEWDTQGMRPSSGGIWMWDRSLSRVEQMMFANDPWQIFQAPRHRSYFFAPTVSFQPAWARSANTVISPAGVGYAA